MIKALIVALLLAGCSRTPQPELPKLQEVESKSNYIVAKLFEVDGCAMYSYKNSDPNQKYAWKDFMICPKQVVVQNTRTIREGKFTRQVPDPLTTVEKADAEPCR